MAITAGDEIKASEVNAEFNKKVNNTGNETIAGIKTFSSIPVLPASNPTTDNEAARKKYVDDKMIISFSDGVIYAAVDEERTADLAKNDVWEKVREIQVLNAGSGITIKVDLLNGGGSTYNAQIYINGSPFGSSQTDNNSTYTTKTFTGISFVANDYVQLYLRVPSGNRGMGRRNFRIYGQFATASATR